MTLLKALSYYTVTAALNNAMPLLLLPILTRFLAPADYGIISTFAAYLALVTPVVLFGVPTLVGIDHFQVTRQELYRRIGAWCLVPAMAAGALAIVFYSARGPISAATHLPIGWIPLLPAIALLGLLPQVLSVLFRVANKPRQFSVFEASQSILQALLTIVLVCVFMLGWRGRMYALVAGGVIASAAAIYFMARYRSNESIRCRDLREMATFGLSLMPHSVLSQLIRMSDRLLVATVFGMVVAGQYAIAAQVAGVMLVLLSTFNQAWTPYLFERLKDPSDDQKRQIVKLSYRILGGMILLAVLTNVAAHCLYRTIIDVRYSSSERYIPWLTLGYVSVGAYLLSTDYLFYAKCVRQLSAVTALNALLSVVGSLAFISRYGAMGAAYGFAFANLITAVCTWILSNRVYPMPWLTWGKQ